MSLTEWYEGRAPRMGRWWPRLLARLLRPAMRFADLREHDVELWAALQRWQVYEHEAGR